MPSFVRRALLGGGAYAFLGALELWFYRFDLHHLAAALGAGAVFGLLLGLSPSVLESSVSLASLTSAFYGGIAGAVWWFVARPPTALLVALVTGCAMGGLYTWCELASASGRREADP